MYKSHFKESNVKPQIWKSGYLTYLFSFEELANEKESPTNLLKLGRKYREFEKESGVKTTYVVGISDAKKIISKYKPKEFIVVLSKDESGKPNTNTLYFKN